MHVEVFLPLVQCPLDLLEVLEHLVYHVRQLYQEDLAPRHHRARPKFIQIK